MTTTFIILGCVVALFVWNRLPVELVAVGTALSLYATGVLEAGEALDGFGDPAVILIASLFVVSEALDATGVTAWAGQALVGRVGNDRSRLLISVLGLVALLTSLISVNGSVATLIPMVVLIAVRTGQPTSQLLMPLAFGAHAGSMLTLTGTPVNVLVSDAAVGAGVGKFGFFEFALVGVPLVVGTLGVVLAIGSRVLPRRTPTSLPADLSDHARVLGLQYLRDHRVYRLAVRADSMCDTTDFGTADRPDIQLIGVQVQGDGHPVQADAVSPGDLLIVRGEPEAVAAFAASACLEFDQGPFAVKSDDLLITRDLGIAEVVIPPRSSAIGERVFPGMITDSGDLVILAIQRRGQDVGPEPVKLAVGDTLLVQGEWGALDHHVSTDNAVLAVDEPEHLRRQSVAMGHRSPEALAITAVMVVLMATGAVPASIAALGAAGAIVLFRVLNVNEVYRGISWTTIVLVGGMIPLSTAMTKTGAAEKVANALVDTIGGLGPHALLLGLFLLTAVLGQLISNMATALIVIPISISAAAELDISARPVLMSVTVAAAAALLTPVATPANLMVMGPGGYRFGDYWKLGLPLLLLYMAVSVGLVPIIWSF